MHIIFEDNDIIVCIKPAGIVSQSDSSDKESMISLLSAHTGSDVFPIHRLDRDVSGIMVYAKNKNSAAKLSTAVANHELIKEYIAIVGGKPSPESGVMQDLLFKDSSRNKSYVVKRPRKGVKEAVLEYRLISTTTINEKTFSAVLIKLHTGRTHQIRVQFSSRKMPLAGDRKYGGDSAFDSIGLWSYRISFNHPTTNVPICFERKPDSPIFKQFDKRP